MSAIDLKKIIDENDQNGYQTNYAVLASYVFQSIAESSGPATVLLILDKKLSVLDKTQVLGDVALDEFEQGDNFTYLWNYACYPAPPHFLRKTYVTNSSHAIREKSEALRNAGHTVYTCTVNMEFGL